MNLVTLKSFPLSTMRECFTFNKMAIYQRDMSPEARMSERLIPSDSAALGSCGPLTRWSHKPGRGFELYMPALVLT